MIYVAMAIYPITFQGTILIHKIHVTAFARGRHGGGAAGSCGYVGGGGGLEILKAPGDRKGGSEQLRTLGFQQETCIKMPI